MSTNHGYAPQYGYDVNQFEPIPYNASLGFDPMNEDEKETFNMQCNIALLNMMGNPMQSRNAMMCPQVLPSDDFPDLSYDAMSGLDPSPLSSTSTSPVTSPLYPTAGSIPFQNMYNTQNNLYYADAYKHKRVEELAKSPRSKSSKQQSSRDTRASSSSSQHKRKSAASGGSSMEPHHKSSKRQ